MSQQRGIRQAIADFRKMREEMSTLERNLPVIIGNEVLAFIHGNFDRQAYNGKKWEKRSPATDAAYDRRGSYKGSVYNSSNPILHQTGNLEDEVHKEVQGRKVFIGINENRIPYGRIHNEGGQIGVGARRVYFHQGRFAKKHLASSSSTARAHNINMPQRQYMPRPSDPEDPVLMRRIGAKILTRRNRIMRKFVK